MSGIKIIVPIAVGKEISIVALTEIRKSPSVS